MHTPIHNQHPNNNTNHQRALTLLETAVIIALAALTLAAMATTLQAAKNQSRSDVCLTNLKALGNAIYTYAAEYNNILPGPAYPGINHHQTMEQYARYLGGNDEWQEYEINRRLTTLLKNVLGTNQTDKQITCPTMATIVPDQHFQEYENRTGRWIWPTHYALNNVYPNEVDYGVSCGAVGTHRITSPWSYFGYSVPDPGLYSSSTSPQPIAKVANASQEWMIADAWYRPRAFAGIAILQQEGSYQWEWSGESLPNFAPHMRRAGQNFTYTNRDDRFRSSSVIHTTKSDGLTNTLFFDGHAKPVASRTASLSVFEILYGFPGTVNNYFSSPSQERYWNMITWE